MKIDLSLHGRREMNCAHRMLQADGYVLETDSCDLYFDTVCEWVELLKSGLYWTGDSRVGKTRCIKSTAERIRIAYPNHAVVILSGETDSNRDSQDRFLKMCLEQARKSSVGNGMSLCARLTAYFINECYTLHGRVLVLFLDEAQAFRGNQLNFLRNVWNRMAMEGYSVLVYSMGNHRLLEDANLEDMAGRQDNVGRFFVKSYRFDGVTSTEALRRILEQYDQALWYPTAEWPFSRYFAQEAYDSGWRLEHEADSLFSSAKAVRGIGELSQGFAGFSMGPLVTAIHAMFKDALLDPSFRPGVDVIPWQEILERHTTPKLLVSQI